MVLAAQQHYKVAMSPDCHKMAPVLILKCLGHKAPTKDKQTLYLTLYCTKLLLNLAISRSTLQIYIYIYQMA